MLKLDISNIESQELLDYVQDNISDYSNIDIAILFRSDYNQGSIIRNLTNFLLGNAGMDSMWKNRFAVIGDELINNSIEYGSLPMDKNIFSLKLSKIENVFDIHLEVQDTGKGLAAKNSAQMEIIRQEKEAEGFNGYLGKRGRGLFMLVTNITDRLYFEDVAGGGLIVGIEKKLNMTN